MGRVSEKALKSPSWPMRLTFSPWRPHSLRESAIFMADRRPWVRSRPPAAAGGRPPWAALPTHHRLESAPFTGQLPAAGLTTRTGLSPQGEFTRRHRRHRTAFKRQVVEAAPRRCLALRPCQDTRRLPQPDPSPAREACSRRIRRGGRRREHASRARGPDRRLGAERRHRGLVVNASKVHRILREPELQPKRGAAGS